MSEPRDSTALIPLRWLLPLRILWVAVLVGAVLALCLATPITYHQGHTLCVSTTYCNGPQLTPAQMQSLYQSRWSVDLYAGYMAGMNLVFGLVYSAIAALIFLRRSQERMALLSSFFFVIFGAVTFPGVPATLASVHPLLHLPGVLTMLLGSTLLALFFSLFPNGRFVPRWIRWFVPILPLFQGLNALAPPAKAPVAVQVFAAIGLLFPILLLIGGQVYRYRKVSTMTEKQQTKWVVLGTGIGLLMFVVLVAAGILLPSSSAGSIYSVILPQTVMYAFMLLLPLSVALAITRSNLWAVDTLINRTLVYASLTVSLVGVYILGVIAVQAIFRAVTGQDSEIAVAIATLGVAGLFNPWRTRVQRFIDHRFYRRKYDTAETLAAFQSRLRDNVDLDRLHLDLAGVVQDTLQPSHFSLWLRPETER